MLLRDRLGATIEAVVSALIRHTQNNVPLRAFETQHTRQSATYDHQNRSTMDRFQEALCNTGSNKPNKTRRDNRTTSISRSYRITTGTKVEI